MSENRASLALEARPVVGRSDARALRRAGRACAVVYGSGAPARAASASVVALNRLLARADAASRLLTLNLDGERILALPREVQRHPVSDAILHVDFLAVKPDSIVQVEAPVNFLNREACRGLRRGGVLSIVRRAVEITCRADAIPDSVDVDLEPFAIGDSIRMSHAPLPEGVAPLITDRDFTIAIIAAPRLGLADDEGADDAESEDGEDAKTES